MTYQNDDCEGEGKAEVVTTNCNDVSCQCGKPEFCDYAQFTMYIGTDTPDCQETNNWVEIAVVLNEDFQIGSDDQKITFTDCDESTETVKQSISGTSSTSDVNGAFVPPPTINACDLGMYSW